MKYRTRFKMWPAVTVALTILSILITPINAFFRHLCHGQIGQGRIDPIVSPGKASAHVHNIQGASNIGFDPSIDQLMASNCTSCSIRQDKSSYWHPQMYFQHDNDTFVLVPTSGGMMAYYFTERPDVGDQVHPFPQNFRMITGDNSKRSNIGPIPDKDMSSWNATDETQEALLEKSIGFNCMNYNVGGTTEGSLQHHYLRNKTFLDNNCPDGIRAEIQFPSCWNGKDLDSVDHKSHVLYPSRLRNGPCPDGFTTRLIVLLYETIYQTNLFNGAGGEFIFANGDPTGYGYHADFIAGWDDGVLQEVIDNPDCTSADSSGVQEACPVFVDIKPVDDPETINCRMQLPDTLKNEDINFIEKLPGDIVIQGVPESASMPTTGSRPLPPSSIPSAVSYANNTAAASLPSTTPSPTLPPDSTNNIVTTTSITVINNTVYHWVILEEVATTTVFAESSLPVGQVKRHAHAHAHGHRHDKRR